jgi:CarD family transcriptional regulator
MTAPFRTSPTITFKAGDMAVHPAHGVGEVLRLEEREHGKQKTTFYVLRILETGTKVMVALESAASVGLRPVMSHEEALDVLRTLRSREVAVNVQPWARRQRVYAEMLKSGSPYEIAKVLRDMSRLRFDKVLSFGERRLLDLAKGMLIHELALAQNVERSAIEGELAAIFCESAEPAA